MTASPPLKGVRVLELGRLFAAPWAGQLLADFGAEVIKIESPEGDPMRDWGFAGQKAFIPKADGEPSTDTSCYATHNRNKQSVALDLDTAEGQDLVRRLAADADVLIENFKVGSLQKRGLDYASINAINPKIVYLSLSGFGQTGPYRNAGGMDKVVQALSGYMSLVGEPGGPPLGSPVPVMDFSAGMYAAVGVLGALYGRDANGGTGRHIDLSLFDCAMALMSMPLETWLLSGKAPHRDRVSPIPPDGTYRAADGYFFLGGAQDPEFRRLCSIAEFQDLGADPRFANRAQRIANEKALRDEVAARIARQDRSHWAERLSAVGLLNAPVNDVPEALEHPQAIHQGIVRHTTRQGAVVPLIRNPLDDPSEDLDARYTAPPNVGQDTEEVLGRVLGLGDEELARLRERGVFGKA